MPLRFFKRKPVATDRLLRMREAAGEDPAKHQRYHKAVNRYQKIVLRAYYLKKRFPFLSVD